MASMLISLVGLFALDYGPDPRPEWPPRMPDYGPDTPPDWPPR